MTFGITGASGGLGALSAQLLLDRVDPAEVVLLTRKPESLAALAARGATVRAADFDDPAGLVEAFAGIDRLLLISTDAVGSRLRQQRAAVDAAAKAGVGHVLYTSAPQPTDDNPAAVIPDHKGTEDHLRASGLGWTMLRNNLYSHMQAGTVQHARATGTLATNAGDGGVAYVTREDCAAVAVAALVATDRGNEVLDVTGPEAITPADLGSLAADAGHSAIPVVALSDADQRAGFVAAGLPEWLAEVLTSFGTATRLGFMDSVSTAVEDLTGRRATSLREALAALR